MPINRDKIDQWKEDIFLSVDFYNNWFLNFAPETFRRTRIQAMEKVRLAFSCTGNYSDISEDILREHPEILATLRMSTCPPIARDRLSGLSGVSRTLLESMENRESSCFSRKHYDRTAADNLKKLSETISRMIDRDIFH